jgi:predicted porin
MKKSLIALAALAAVSAASAQSSVTLYGLIDVGYGSHETVTRDGSGKIKSSGVMDGANAGNRVGFRGTEDLGGGLKANFVIEQGLNVTNGSLFAQRAAAAGHQVDGFSSGGSATALSGAAGAYSVGTNRQSYAALETAAMGTVRIGYQYTALYELGTLSGYAVGSEGIPGADKAHLHGQVGVGGTRANMIQYISPAFSGFTARVQYGAGTGRETVEATTARSNGLTTDNARRMGLMLQYANGPISASAAYTNMRLQTGNVVGGVQTPAGAATSIFNVTGAAGTVAQTGLTRTASLFQVGGSYDFGVAKLAGTYNKGKNDGTATSTLNSDYKAFQVGVTVPFGAIVPFIAYGRATTDTNAVRNEDYKQLQAGVRYSLSKRTLAYAMYGRTTNDAAALTGSTSFYKDSKTIVGVAHSF